MIRKKHVTKLNKKVEQHYVDNKLFLQELITYKKQVKLALKKKLPKPRVSDYIGSCFLSIARNLSTKGNFYNYTFKEDFVGDATENCLMYIDNFDPEKSLNPFSYFTQIVYFAFLRRIFKEKKNLYIKYKSLENFMLFNNVDSKVEKLYEDLSSQSQDFVETFEELMEKKKIINKKKDAGLSKLFDEEND